MIVKYNIDFECNDDDPDQALLNRIYSYENDIPTKIQHRKRLNLFYTMMMDLKKRNLIKENAEAADIGCGSGIYTALISEFGYKKVTGVDISTIGVENAKNFFPPIRNGREIEFIIGDAQTYNPDSAYDFILCTEVIEHTDNPTAVIDNIGKMLKPDGIAIISMPNLLSIPMFELIAGSVIRREPLEQEAQQHLDYPFFDVIEMFKKGGFEIVEYRGSNLFIGAFSTRFLYGRSGFAALNRLDSWLGKKLPLCCFSQYFYIVIRKS